MQEIHDAGCALSAYLPDTKDNFAHITKRISKTSRVARLFFRTVDLCGDIANGRITHCFDLDFPAVALLALIRLAKLVSAGATFHTTCAVSEQAN